MRLLVPDAMPLSLLPEPENARPELSFRLILDIDDAGYAEDGDAWWPLRRYEPEPEGSYQID
jgi:hypothetical protein